MNDVNRNGYGPDKTGREFDQKHQSSLAFYSDSMRTLLEALSKTGARLILIQPSIFDQTTTLPGAGLNATGSNDALPECWIAIAQWAKEYHARIVNFFGAMNEINQREQKKDPNYTLVGKDRIRPEPVGHFVMAYTFPKAQGMPRDVAMIDVRRRRRRRERS